MLRIKLQFFVSLSLLLCFISCGASVQKREELNIQYVYESTGIPIELDVGKQLIDCHSSDIFFPRVYSDFQKLSVATTLNNSLF